MNKPENDVENNNILSNILNFIGKDTAGQNESKKVTVIIRIIILSFLAYSICNIFLCNLFQNILLLGFCGLFLAIFTGIFAASYRCRTFTVLWLFNITTITWTVGVIHYFGWNVGVQHFLMVLMILYFFSSYKHYVSKVLFAMFLCIFRIILFFLYHTGTAALQIAPWQENLLQITNTVTIFWCMAIISLICSKDGQELEGKLVEYNNQLIEEAGTDTLTGLFNRRKAMACMEDIISNSKFGGGYSQGLSICICDIDFFKKVNDTYGHDFGDEVLKAISRVFKEIPERCIAARWGGEEFLLIFPDCNGDDAYIALETVRDKIKNTVVEKDDVKVSVTMTFGLTEYDFANGLEATIKEADEKLYMGKNSGRDIIIF